MVRCRPPSSGPLPPIETDPGALARVASDAAHYPGRGAAGVARPRSTDEVSALLASGAVVLPVGAQSSLTGGATPMGELVLCTDRLTSCAIETGARVRAGAGLTLQALQDALAAHGWWLPPVPTYLGATVGGAAATNAAGAATFKYGTMRDWIVGLELVLAGGDRLALARGEATAGSDGTFTIATSRGPLVVPVPPYRMPDVPKRSAGYHAAPGMDLVDLFVGSEGTLAVITEVVLRVAPRPAGVCWALVPVPDEPSALALAGALRAEAERTWAAQDPRGVDIAAIEYLDRRAIEILREDGVDRRLDVRLPNQAGAVLLVQMELAAPSLGSDLWAQMAGALEPGAPDTPLVRLCRVLAAHGVLEETEVVLPDRPRRAAALAGLREAVPAGVNRRVAEAKAAIDPALHKIAADVIVPFARVGEMLAVCRSLFAERDLDLVVWGHLSDGNLHPNALPRRPGDLARGREAVLALGQTVVAMGGCPLAEHGVGRHPVKQRLLELLHGRDGVAAMRAVKRTFDPSGQLAPGVLWAPDAP